MPKPRAAAEAPTAPAAWILSEQPSRIVCHVQRLNSDYWWAVPVAPAELPAGASEATISVQPADIQAAIQHLPDRDG